MKNRFLTFIPFDYNFIMNTTSKPLVCEVVRDIFLICIRNKLFTCFAFRGMDENNGVMLIKPRLDSMKRIARMI